MKVAEDAAQELPLNDERIPVKKNRHVTIALNHLNKRLASLLCQKGKLDIEIEEVTEAITALE